MADLTSCYFCGTVGDLREYPVIPRDLYPPADAQRTVTLCPTCREKLGTVVQPLVEFVESDGPEREPAARNDGAVAADAGATDGDAASTRDDEARAADAGATGEDATTANAGEASGKSLEDLLEEPSTTLYTDSRGAGYRWEPGEREDPAVDADLPEGTRKVARLLRNRSFPVERAEIEDLAASAYDLGASECREIVDALIEDGYLVERGDVLERPG